jgi:hypothetical protein
MSHITRILIMFSLIVLLLVSSTAVSAAFNGGDWSSRQIRVLCDGYPGSCPCPTC